MANRKKKALLSKIDKTEKAAAKEKLEDARIFQNLKKKMRPDELEKENESLRTELAELKKAKANAKKMETIHENKVVEEVKAPPPPPVKKELTARQKMKLLKNL